MGAFGPLPYGGRLTMPSVPHKKASVLMFTGKSGALAAVLSASLGPTKGGIVDNPSEITAAHAREWVDQGIGQIIDVRFPEEIELWGPLAQAELLPLSCLQRFCGFTPNPHCEEFSARDLTVAERTGLTQALVRYAAQHKVLLCLCRSGNRSLAAVHLLRELGFVHAYSIIGGLEAWEATSKTASPPKDPTTSLALPEGSE